MPAAAALVRPAPLLLTPRPVEPQGTGGLLPQEATVGYLEWYEYFVLTFQGEVSLERALELWHPVLVFHQRALQLNQWLKDDVDTLVSNYEQDPNRFADRFQAARFLIPEFPGEGIPVQATHVRNFLRAENWEQLRLQIGICLKVVQQGAREAFPASLCTATGLIIEEYGAVTGLQQI